MLKNDSRFKNLNQMTEAKNLSLKPLKVTEISPQKFTGLQMLNVSRSSDLNRNLLEL